MPEADELDIDAFNEYIYAQVILLQGDHQVLGTAMAQQHDLRGNPIGQSNIYHIIDTRIYEVSFTDGHIVKYTTNTIPECL
jgi:hypothetical protein